MAGFKIDTEETGILAASMRVLADRISVTVKVDVNGKGPGSEALQRAADVLGSAKIQMRELILRTSDYLENVGIAYNQEDLASARKMFLGEE